MADFTIEGIIEVDASRAIRSLTRFEKKLNSTFSELEKVDRMVKRLDNSNIRVKVDVDKSGLRDLNAEMKNLDNVDTAATINADDALDDIEKLQREMDALDDQTLNISIDSDKAIAKAMKTRLDIEAALADIDAEVDVDGLDEVTKSVKNATDAIKGPSGLISAALLLGTTLAPLGAVAGGLGGAMVASFTGAGIGAVGFAAMAAPAVKEVAGAVKLLSTDLSTLEGKDLKEIKKQLASLKEESPGIYKVAEGVLELKDQFMDMAKSNQPRILNIFTKWLETGSSLLDKIEPGLADVTEGVWKLAVTAKRNLSGDEWTKFFDYMNKNASRFLRSWARTVGNFITGIANMIRAFTPLTRFFNAGMMGMSRDFREWSDDLKDNEGFQEFVQYVKEQGPKVAKMIGVLIKFFIDLGQAVAPAGEVLIELVTQLAELFSTLQDGHPEIASFLAIMLVTAPAVLKVTGAMSKLIGSFSTGEKQVGKFQGAMRAGSGVAGMGLMIAASKTTDDNLKTVLNTAGMVAMGFSVGGPWGAAIGGAVGIALEFASANDEMDAALQNVRDTMENGSWFEQQQGLLQYKAAIDKATAGLTNLTSVTKTISDPLTTAKSLFLVLTGQVEKNRNELQQFHDRAAHFPAVAGLFGDPLGLIARDFEDADEAMQKFTDSFDSLDKVLGKSESLVAYEQAVDDFSAALKENGNVWDTSTEKGRANIEARNELVQTAITRAEALKRAGDDLGAQRVLQRAIKDIKAFVGDSELGKQKAREVIEELERLSKKHARPEIDANNKPAKDKIDTTNKWLVGIDKKVVTAALDGNNEPVRKKIDAANSWLLNFDKKSPTASMDGEASGFWDVVAGINNYQIPDKTVTVRTVNVTGMGPQGDDGLGGATDPNPKKKKGGGKTSKTTTGSLDFIDKSSSSDLTAGSGKQKSSGTATIDGDGGGGKSKVINITNNYPKPEKGSDATFRAMQKLAYLGLDDDDDD